MERSMETLSMLIGSCQCDFLKASILPAKSAQFVAGIAGGRWWPVGVFSRSSDEFFLFFGLADRDFASVFEGANHVHNLLLHLFHVRESHRSQVIHLFQ